MRVEVQQIVEFPPLKPLAIVLVVVVYEKAKPIYPNRTTGCQMTQRAAVVERCGFHYFLLFYYFLLLVTCYLPLLNL